MAYECACRVILIIFISMTKKGAISRYGYQYVLPVSATTTDTFTVTFFMKTEVHFSCVSGIVISEELKLAPHLSSMHLLLA